jgi:uncharacterized OB-fold protein
MKIEEKINWKKCNKCGLLQHSSHLRCLKCKNDKFTYIESTGKCTLLTYTVLKAPPAEFRDNKSYALGIVKFENGVKALGQLTTNRNLKIGMKLKPIYRKICERMDGHEIYSFVFEPNDLSL